MRDDHKITFLGPDIEPQRRLAPGSPEARAAMDARTAAVRRSRAAFHTACARAYAESPHPELAEAALMAAHVSQMAWFMAKPLAEWLDVTDG